MTGGAGGQGDSGAGCTTPPPPPTPPPTYLSSPPALPTPAYPTPHLPTTTRAAARNAACCYHHMLPSPRRRAHRNTPRPLLPYLLPSPLYCITYYAHLARHHPPAPLLYLTSRHSRTLYISPPTLSPSRTATLPHLFFLTCRRHRLHRLASRLARVIRLILRHAHICARW